MSEDETPETMTQVAPFPTELAEIVATMTYRVGYRFALDHIDRGQGSEGLTFMVRSVGMDTYDHSNTEMRVWHYFPVPAASYNRQSWLRWVLDRLIELEQHEACEFFKVAGKMPFAPNHGPGWDPYAVRELNRLEDAETSFQGIRDEGSQA